MMRCHLIVALFGLAPALAAQSSIRCWGEGRCDTEVTRVQAAQVVAGLAQTCVRRVDGRIFTRGFSPLWWNNLEAPEPPAGTHYVDMDSNVHSIGLLSDGTIRQWGQLSSTLFHAPPPLPVFPSGVTVSSVSSGSTFSLALLSDGSLVAWGATPGVYGQFAVPSLAAGLSYVRAYAGGRHGVAVVSDGSLRAWGDQTFGQLSVPTLPAGTAWLDAGAGIGYCVALRSDGQVLAWGRNDFGQTQVPALPSGMSYVSIRAGDTHAMALRSDGQLVAWGLNDWGQCNVPALPPGTSWQSFDAGGLYSVAVRSDGEVVCWGRNYYFEGNIPALPPQRYYESFACGARTIVAVMDDGQLQAWGDSSAGATNVPQPAGRFFTAVDASMWVSGGLLDDGTILVWGWNGYNQQTVPVLPVGVTYTAIAVGGGHVLGLRSDGNVEAWGSNDVGQTVIPALPPGTTYTQIRSYERCNLMLRSDGALVASGLPSQAQAAVAAPTLPAGERWRLIDMGDHIFGGISTEGQLYFWGSAPAWLAPTPPGVVWVEFACNRGRAVARRSDGVAFEVTNQLGTYYSLLPAPDLEPGTSYLSVSAGHETFAARVGAESSFVTFASGCSGSMPTSRQIPHDTPQLGRQLEVSVDHLPLDVAFVAFGRQRLATPLSLSGVGMPGCAAHIAIDGMVAVVGSNNRATWTWSLPDDPTIRGQRFVTQAIVLDTGAGNALGAVVSDAAEGLIGGGM